MKTYLKGGGFSGTEEELLPTVYGGGYSNTAVGANASLTVQNSNDNTMFKAIYMGHETETDNKVPYKGNAELNLDTKATVRDRVDTEKNSSAAVTIKGNGLAAKATKFYGSSSTTLNLDQVIVERAELSNIGAIVLMNEARLQPITNSFQNVQLQSRACLDLSGVEGEPRIYGDFQGTTLESERGILVLNKGHSITIDGTITGTTQFQTGGMVPGLLNGGQVYIKATNPNKANSSNFVLAQKSIDNGYSLQYNSGQWTAAGQLITRDIGKVSASPSSQRVDLRKITVTGDLYDEETIPDKSVYFGVQWLDEEGSMIDKGYVTDYGFYVAGNYVFGVRTDDWQNNCINVDVAHQHIALIPSDDNDNKYFLKADSEAQPGDYIFLFFSDDMSRAFNIGDLKNSSDKIKGQCQVSFYNEDETETTEETSTASTSDTATTTSTGSTTTTAPTSSTTKPPTTAPTSGTTKPTTTPTGSTTKPTTAPTTGETVTPPTEPTTTPPTEPSGDHKHQYQSSVTKQATCTEEGIRTYTCTCGHTYTEPIAPSGHQYEEERIPATGKTDGKVQKVCKVCSHITDVYVISRPRNPSWSKAEFTYDGKTKTPEVSIRDTKGNEMVPGADYEVLYPKAMKNPGIYTVVVEFCGDYSGRVTKTITIKPRKASLKKAVSGSKRFLITWNRQTVQIDGYQVQYSRDKAFKGKSSKTVTVKKNAAGTTIKKLKGKTKYYVRVRTYKNVKVSGKSKKLYSDWSGKKAVYTKR